MIPDFLEDYFGDERWALYLFLISGGLLGLIGIFSSPLFIIILTYILFILFFWTLILVTILGSRYLSLYIDDKLYFITFYSTINIVVKSISFFGIIYSFYIFLSGIISYEWSSWGIVNFVQSMTSKNIDSYKQGVTLFNPNVFSKFVFMVKALYINIGKHIILIIWNFIFPFNAISAGITILKL